MLILTGEFLFPAGDSIELRREVGKPHAFERGLVLLVRELRRLGRISERAAQGSRRYIVLLRDEHHGFRRRQQDAAFAPRPKASGRAKETGLAAAPLADYQNPLSGIDHDIL